MLAVDDILDDAHWVNVQDPIKQMFLSITKALRVQASSIRELDRKCSDFVTKDFVRHQVHTVEDSVCSKQDATQIIYQMQNKVDQKDYATLQTRYDQVVQHADRLQSTVHDQALEIQSLSTHITQLEKEIDVLKHPNYDQIFAYIDRQVDNLSQDTERKLQIKADKREMETVIPQRLEELYRNLNTKYQEVKIDVAKAATKEELIAVAQSKVDRMEIRDLAADLHDKVSRADAANLISVQTKPLFTALTAMEKAQHVSDQRILAQQQDLLERFQSFQRQYQDHVVNFHPPNNNSDKLSAEKVISLVQEYLRDRKLEDMTRVHLDSMFAQNTEYLMKQMGILGESIRLEIVSSNREEMNMLQQKYEASLNDNISQTKEITEKHQKTRQAVKELSTNVSKALSKKVDVSDYHRLLKKLDGLEKLDESNRIRRRLGGTMEPTSSANKRSNVVSSNDPNETFDVLIQSLKTSSSSSSSGQEAGSRRSSSRGKERLYDDAEDGANEYNDDDTNWGRESKLRSSSSFARLNNTRNSSSPTRRIPVSPSRLSRTQNVSFSKPGRTTSLEGIDELYEEMDMLRTQLSTLTKQVTALSPHPLSVGQQEVDRLDWRIALGDLSLQLRRDLSDKVSREEMLSFMKDEVVLMSQKLKPFEQVMEKEWTRISKDMPQEISRISHEITTMRQRISAEITGARFLWTSGRYTSLVSSSSSSAVETIHSWIPWERQVVNDSPNCILWRRDSPVVTVKVPGLYQLTISIFTTSTSVMQKLAVYLNDEMLFVMRTTNNNSPVPSNNTSPKNGVNSINNSNGLTVSRYRHSLGDVCSFTLEEYVSLPPEARLSVCILRDSLAGGGDAMGAMPQGFLSLKKL